MIKDNYVKYYFLNNNDQVKCSKIKLREYKKRLFLLSKLISIYISGVNHIIYSNI